MSKTVSFIAWCGVAIAALFPGYVFADDAAQEMAVRAAKQFIQAIKAKDIDAVIKVSGLPWFDAFEERIVKDGPELKQFWTEKLRDFDYSTIPLESVRAESYGEFREWTPNTGNDDFDAFLRKTNAQIVAEFDKVLGKPDWIVKFADKNGRATRFVLVRIRDGKAAIVGGPSGGAYLSVCSRIPKEARTLLAKADGFRLFSLDPKPQDSRDGDFHNWRVLGEIDIEAKNGDTRKKLVNALRQGAEEGDSAFAGCFKPRHGLRVSRQGKVVDFVICFECYSVQVYADDEKESQDNFQISGSAQRVFDEVLRAAGIPLADNAKK